MTTPTEPLLRYLRRLTAPSDHDASDAALLERFRAQGDEAAFATLLVRHGPMVHGVCRRILGDAHDAEDAFQATFLVLARKAGSLRRPEALATWLYGIARRLASTTRRADCRRRQREARCLLSAIPPSQGDLLDDLSARELLLALDEEMARLPERYRLPLILCYLEGRTHEEAARLLGWTAGSVKGRLERGRKKLHSRLSRRGLELSGALLALAASHSGSTSAASRLASTTLQAALAFARGKRGGIAATVMALAETGAASMTMAKTKIALVLLLTLGLAAGTAVLVHPVSTEMPPETKQAKPPESAKAEKSSVVLISPMPTARAQQAKRTEPPKSTKSETAQRPRTDLYGDPLPPGALMRLGTLRFRLLGRNGGRLLSDQRTRLFYREDAIFWRDSQTLKEIDHWDVPRGITIKAVSLDGKRALLSDGKTMQLWDTASRKRMQTLDCKNKGSRIDGYFSPDGKTIVTCQVYNQSGLVRVWDMAAGKELWHDGALMFGPIRDGIFPVGFPSDGRTMIVLHNKDNTISVRDLRTGRVQRSFSTVPVNDSRQYGLSPDDRTVMIGTAGQAVRSWDLASGKENPPLGGHKGQAYTFAFSDDSKSVATGGEDSFVQVWDWPSGRLRRRIDLGSGSVFVIAFTPHGQQLKVLIFGERVWRYWDLKTGRELPKAADGHRGSVYGVVYLPNGEIVSTGQDNTVRVWDAASGRTLRQFPTHLSFGANKLSLSADGKTLAVSEYNRPDIQILEVASGRKLRTLKPAFNSCSGICFSPTDNILASTSLQEYGKGSAVQLWEVASGREVRRIDSEFCSRPTFSPDGQSLAIHHRAGVGIWRVATGERNRSISLKDPRGLAFSPDGRALAIGSPEGGIIVWEVATAKERLRLKPPDSWSAELRFSPDGCYLASTGGDTRTVYLWDARTGELIHRFTGIEAGPQSLAFSANGRVLAASYFDTTILLWDAAAVTTKRRTPAAKLSAKEIETRWDTLAGADATAAYRAIGALTASPPETIAFLRQRLRRVEPVEEKTIAKLVHDLDSPIFDARERASAELAKLDRLAEPALRQALTGQPSLEMRRRVRQLLEKLASFPTGTRLRPLRAVEVLERIGTAEVRSILETLAAGASEARLKQDAKASLARLAPRAAVKP